MKGRGKIFMISVSRSKTKMNGGNLNVKNGRKERKEKMKKWDIIGK